MSALSTQHVLLRPLSEQDREQFVALYSSERVMRHIFPALTSHSAERYFSKILQNAQRTNAPYMFWSICQANKPSQPVGIVALIFDQKDSVRAEIGIVLKPFVKCRYAAFDAMLEVMLYASNRLGTEDIYAMISPENKAAINLGHRLGFVLDPDAAVKTQEGAHNRWLWQPTPELLLRSEQQVINQ